MTDEKCPTCGRSRDLVWKARNGQRTWLCCDECKRGAGRMRSSVVFERRIVDVEQVDAAQAPPEIPGQSNILDHLEFAAAEARHGDPETSHAAARAVTAHQTEAQRKVLALIHTVGRPFTDEELVDVAPRFGVTLTGSSIRTRRKELTVAGLVVDAGYTAKGLHSNRQHQVWRLA